jgi:hypothetical protein
VKNANKYSMKFQVRQFVIVFLILSGISVSDSFSQVPVRKPTRQSAMDAFARNDYELAATQFRFLSDSYPKDPLYKYYNGVCLVKLNREFGKAESLLRDAVQGSAAIRSVPNDGLFWLGKAQQMGGKFDDAIKSYNKFTELSGKKAAKELDVPALIKQCGERKGQVIPTGNVINEEKKADTVRNKPVIAANAQVPPIRKYPEAPVAPPEKVNDSYDQLLSQALAFQVRSDSLSRLAAGYRKEMVKADNSAKAALKAKVQNLEDAAASNQKMADKKMTEARKMIGKPVDIKPADIKPDTARPKTLPAAKPVIADSIRKPIVENRPVVVKDTIRPAKNASVPVKDTIIAIKEKQPELKIAPPAEQKVKKDTLPQTQNVEKKPVAAETGKPVFSVFEIKEKPVFAADEKIHINPEVPAGLIYRIQVAVFKNPVAPSYFKGIEPVFGFRNEATGVSNYYAGMFRKSADAGKALTRVKTIGFKDAFVVALMDKKVVSADRAALLEKEWGSKPLFTETPKVQIVAHDTIPPTLVFRVEVARSAKPLPPDQAANIRKMSGDRGFDIFVNNTKQNIYLVGKFLTYKSAVEYADLMVRNGFKDSKVVAYLGFREIPVSVAQQLFEEK